MRINSLAFRLIATSIGWSIIVLAIVGFILSSLFRNAVETNFDTQLELLLDAVINNVELNRRGKLAEVSDMGVVRFNLPFSGWYWQVSARGGPVEEGLASLSLLDKRLVLPKGAKTAVGKLHKTYLPGPETQRVRAIVHQTRLVGSPKLFDFYVAGIPTQLEQQVADFNRALEIALSLVAVGLAIAVFLQVQFGLLPLNQMRRALTRIRSGKQERLTDQYPVEISSLANELNGLLTSNQEIIERSRTHVGNLAHALKTPLSVITNEAQTTRGKFAAKVAEQAQVMGDQVNLYLDRARMAARARVIGAITDINPVVLALARTLERIHADRGITSKVEIAEDLKFRGEKQDLEEMLGNLLDNAFKWANSSVLIHAHLQPGTDPAASRIALVVEDDGPGLPSQRRADALERGKRLDETKPGSGLGLSIVAELAALYEGDIELSDAGLGGLKIIIRLPAG